MDVSSADELPASPQNPLLCVVAAPDQYEMLGRVTTYFIEYGGQMRRITYTTTTSLIKK